MLATNLSVKPLTSRGLVNNATIQKDVGVSRERVELKVEGGIGLYLLSFLSAVNTFKLLY